jgi:Mor family transcriptional regulator
MLAMKEEWGKTGYDDLLRKYRIGKRQLYFIITKPPKAVAKKLKKSLEAVKLIRERHDLIIREYRRYHG